MRQNREISAVICALGLGLVPVWGAPPAQQEGAPLESVTVTANKPTQAAIDKFITAHATPTRMTGKMARWTKGICPQTIGLGPKFAKYTSQRVRDVAASVGAPVDKDASCKTNVQIVFTTKPQALLDAIRRDHPIYLGYFDNRLESARLATVSHAIQSWYTTATDDLRGHAEVDIAQPGGVTIEMPLASGNSTSVGGSGYSGTFTMNLPGASIKSVTGGRLGDGLSSEFTHIVIVAEPDKLVDFEVGTVADYIAMLALSQPGSVDDCQQLPSITNILAPGCSMSTRTITDGDLAYLRGLYKMTPAGNLQAQRGEVRYQMEQILKPEGN